MTNHPGNLAVVTSFFNPSGYKRLKKNYMNFSEHIISQSADLWTIEIAFGKDPFFIKPSNRVIQMRTPDIMWQKERGLNLLIENLSEEYDKIIWVDSDMIFEDHSWIEKASELLEKYSMIQCFGTMSVIHPNGDIVHIKERCGVVKAVANNHEHPQKNIYGGAWAARRSVIKKNGLFDQHILGHSDLFMVAGLFQWHDHPHIRLDTPPALKRNYFDWAQKILPEVQNGIGYLDTNMHHLWHGDPKNRKYKQRLEILMKHNFNPNTDISIGSNGLWHWSSNKPELHADIKQYFVDRNDDEPFSCPGTNLVKRYERESE